MKVRVLVVYGLPSDAAVYTGRKDEDEQPIFTDSSSTAFGPLPDGISFGDFLRDKGWVAAEDRLGYFEKTVNGIKYTATQEFIPNTFPLRFLP